MSSFSLKDALTGAAARIRGNGRMAVQSSNIDILVQKAWDSGEAFFTTTGQMPLPEVADAGGYDTPLGVGVHWVRNTHPTKSLIIEKVYWTCDGGPQRDDQFLCQFVLADPLTPPVAGMATSFEAAFAKRTNMGNVSAPPIEQYAWDKVARINGLDVPLTAFDATRKFNGWRVGNGASVWNWNGRIVVPPNAPAIYHIFNPEGLVAAQVPKEVINVSFDLHYYMADLSSNPSASAYE